MRCEECGADPPGDETCLDRWHLLLQTDFSGNEEAMRVHGVQVLTYHIQHPSRLTGKPWILADQQEMMRRMTGAGGDWEGVLREYGRQQHFKLRRRVRRDPAQMPTGPIAGEMTMADIDPLAPPGHVERVLAWARSVATHRGLVEPAAD